MNWIPSRLGVLVDKQVGVQCETVELTTARVQIDENDDAGVRTSLEAQRQCPVVEHDTGCDEDATVLTHHVDSSFEAQYQCLVDECEAGCDEDASPMSTYGPLETMHTDVAASNESSTATLNLGRRRRSERTASPTHHTRQNWTLSLMPWSSWLAKMGVIGCLCARFRCGPPCAWSDWRNSSKNGSVWESSAGIVTRLEVAFCMSVAAQIEKCRQT